MINLSLIKQSFWCIGQGLPREVECYLVDSMQKKTYQLNVGHHKETIISVVQEDEG